jgi:hypothetical protein
MMKNIKWLASVSALLVVIGISSASHIVFADSNTGVYSHSELAGEFEDDDAYSSSYFASAGGAWTMSGKRTVDIISAAADKTSQATKSGNLSGSVKFKNSNGFTGDVVLGKMFGGGFGLSLTGTYQAPFSLKRSCDSKKHLEVGNAAIFATGIASMNVNMFIPFLSAGVGVGRLTLDDSSAEKISALDSCKNFVPTNNDFQVNLIPDGKLLGGSLSKTVLQWRAEAGVDGTFNSNLAAGIKYVAIGSFKKTEFAAKQMPQVTYTTGAKNNITKSPQYDYQHLMHNVMFTVKFYFS